MACHPTAERIPSKMCSTMTWLRITWAALVENDCAIVIEQNSVFNVKLHGAGEYLAFGVATLATRSSAVGA